ncbi:MAG: thioredoxin domain-containing protein [Gemmatimonadota bacterium]
MANRLANESSPYLLQHQHNPVDWYPWGDEALARARAEDQPILLSVGYSACHWCHVMEHESFADPETAALMNERFVNIKVDREERPDIDSLYMQAVQQMTGQGGWPMTVFLKPDGSAFYGGTYFPPEPRHGMPSFRQILLGVSEAYTARRDEVDRSAAGLKEALSQGMAVNPEPATVDEATMHRAFQTLAGRFDSRFGGFGGAPKFPQPMIIDFLLRYWSATGVGEALSMAERTLEAMARGGIYDQVGGGFHRYSVDARWLVPHFEKMLYDNALLSATYLAAYQATGRPDFREVAVDILTFVEREMTSPEGAFYSSQDADSEGIEGKFYVWSADEIDAALEPDEASLFRRCYGISEAGNWEGTNIPHMPRSIGEVAAEVGVSEEEIDTILQRARHTLYEKRAGRVQPARDDKVLTGWNAMMMRAFADAGWVLADDHFREVAVANADFLLGEMRSEDRLLRSWRAGTARIDAFLEDHATLVEALVALYRATLDPRWVAEARWVADRMIDRFWSTDEEIFYDTPEDGESLILRPRDIYDNASPSGTSSATRALQGLASLTGEPEYERIATRVVRSMAEVASQVPQAFGHLLGAVAHHLAVPSEVAIVGDPESEDTAALLDVLRTRFLPYTAVALRSPSSDEDIEAALPVLAHRTARGGAATAYVCRSYTCRQPVTTPAELQEEINYAVRH